MARQPAANQRSLPYVTISRGLVLLAAAVSFVLSVVLWFSGNELEGIFVGLWVPSILALGALVVRGDGERS
jgi:hypothetical protein